MLCAGNQVVVSLDPITATPSLQIETANIKTHPPSQIKHCISGYTAIINTFLPVLLIALLLPHIYWLLACDWMNRKQRLVCSSTMRKRKPPCSALDGPSWYLQSVLWVFVYNSVRLIDSCCNSWLKLHGRCCTAEVRVWAPSFPPSLFEPP